MNRKINVFVAGSAILLGLFAGAINVSAQYFYTSDTGSSYDSGTYTGSSNTSSNTSSSKISASPSDASTDSAKLSSSCNSATLYGTVTPNGTSTSAWFEWGDHSYLGNATSRKTFTSDGILSQTISGLQDDTLYFYRIVVSNKYGSVNGNTLTFRTSNCSTPTPPSNPTPPATSTPPANTMVGNYNVNCSVISGSVYNSSSPSGSVTVSIYNGVPGMASVVGTATTNSSHSFSLNTPSAIKDGSTYQVWATANGILFDDYENFNSSNCPTSTPISTPVISNSNVVNNTNNTISNSTNSNILNNSSNNTINSNNTTNIVTYIPNNGGGNGDNNDAPSVTTKSATSISTTSATLNGQVDGNGSTTNVWFEWGDDRNNLDETTSERSVGSGNTTFNSHISGLRRDTTYYFRAVAENNDGDDEGSILSFRTDDNGNSNNNNDAPDVTTRSATNITETTATLRGEVDGNGSSTRAWFEWGTDRNNLNRETDDQSTSSGNDTFDERITGLRNNTTYYFRAVAENDEDTDTGSVLSFRTGNDNSNDNNNDSTAPTAVTTPATFITGNSAQLNSLILTNGDDDTDTWFEWGSSIGLGNETRKNDIGTATSVRNASTITGLVPGITYYFRAVAENSEWRNNGSILSFVTGNVAGASTNTIVRNTTTVINRGSGTNSLVMLTIDGGSEFITANEKRQYNVTWKNISSQTLKNVVLQVILPKSMSFNAASDGSISNDNSTLTFDIDNLTPSETGDLSFLASTDNSLKDGELVVVVANLVYTDASNAQGDALAYFTHTAYTGGSVLGANVFGAGLLPNSLFGWLLLIILILILLVLAKQFMNRSANHPVPVVVTPPQH